MPPRDNDCLCSYVIDLIFRAHGIGFEGAWLAPFAEFRFPRLGHTVIDRAAGIDLELRQAVEPWHVLGEEATAGGTARYVDSSVERIQVSVRGIDPRRHLVTCQGVPVPLTPTGTGPAEWYAGIRYKAWQPWSALHPSIAVHSPLRVEVVDTESATSLGGATYHVVHPGGQGYEHLPVNANEAEARRQSRFDLLGHATGEIDIAALRLPAPGPAHDYPRTLDLRRIAGAGRMPPTA